MYTNINSLKLKIVVKKFSIMCDGRDNTKKLYNYFHYGPLKKNSSRVYWYKKTGNIWKAQKYIIVSDIVSINIVNIDEIR